MGTKTVKYSKQGIDKLPNDRLGCYQDKVEYEGI